MDRQWTSALLLLSLVLSVSVSSVKSASADGMFNIHNQVYMHVQVHIFVPITMPVLCVCLNHRNTQLTVTYVPLVVRVVSAVSSSNKCFNIDLKIGIPPN